MRIDDRDEYDKIADGADIHSGEFWDGFEELQQQYVQLYFIFIFIFILGIIY
jgi:hypothetical protein